MILVKKSRIWNNPLTKTKGYVQRYEVKDMGQVDLIASFCARSNRKHSVVAPLVIKIVDELIRLLLEGYQVNIPGLGVIEPKIECKMVPYGEVRRLSRKDLGDVVFKVHRSPELQSQIKTAVENCRLE